MRVRRSVLVGLALVLCYLVAWLDRTAISLTLRTMSDELGMGPDVQGWVVSAFFLGYALCQIPGGMLADRFGPRRVILGALAWWSVFTALTGSVGTLASMLSVRFLFGVGEGVFPASVWKVLGGWFTRRNRATANGLVISSIALGPALTPILLAPVLATLGWRSCFHLLGLLGALCVIMAWATVHGSIREAKRVSRQELDEFEADARSAEATAERSLATSSFLDLLREPVVWVLFSIGLIANVAMYGWIMWLPSYLQTVKHLSLASTAWAAALPFAFGTAGCMAAGYVSDRFFRGRRKWLVFGCFLLGGASLYAFTVVGDFASAMACQCLAGFLLFMAAGSLWALPMVLLPTRLMGSGSGFINTGGQIGGVLSGVVIGYAIEWAGGDYGRGFDVMLVALMLSAALALLGIRREGLGGRAAPAAARA